MMFQSQNGQPVNVFNAQAKIGRVIGPLFIVVGSLMAIGGCIWLFHTIWFVTHAAKTIGQVIRMDEDHDRHGTTYRPVYTFSDASGTVHTQACSMSSSDYSFEVGEKVTILYNPASPKYSNIDSFGTVWLGPIFLSIFGLLFGGFAAGWLYCWNLAIRKRTIP